MRFMIAVIWIFLVAATLRAQEDRQADFFRAVSALDAVSVRAMLDQDPSLAAAKRPNGMTAVLAAMFAIPKGAIAFTAPAANDTLQAILARKPALDLSETAALGSPESPAATRATAVHPGGRPIGTLRRRIRPKPVHPEDRDSRCPGWGQRPLEPAEHAADHRAGCSAAAGTAAPGLPPLPRARV